MRPPQKRVFEDRVMTIMSPLLNIAVGCRMLYSHNDMSKCTKSEKFA